MKIRGSIPVQFVSYSPVEWALHINFGTFFTVRKDNIPGYIVNGYIVIFSILGFAISLDWRKFDKEID